MSNELNIQPNTIFCRDNLDVLQGTNSACIDLIYLDPPFNKKKVFTAPIGSSAEGAEFSDIFREEDVKDEWVETIKYENTKLYEYLKGVKSFSNIYNYCYLAYMAIRLIECHRVLKDTGSVYLHCDPTMSHYLKIVLDCVFGEENFQNEIIWCYKTGGSSKKNFAKKHDVILFYSKSNLFQFNNPKEKSYMGAGYNTGNKNVTLYADENKSSFGPYTMVNMKDWWEIGMIATSNKSERTGYPTQKPLMLLERIIKSATNENDVVLDPFCGCATTCVAAEKLNRQWIGVDISFKAFELVTARLAKEVEWVDTLFEEEKVIKTTIAPQRTDTNEHLPAGNIYVISNPKWKGEYKVGIAKNVNSRLHGYQTSDPNRGYKLEYERSTPHYKKIEKHIHEKFENKHEWVAENIDNIIYEIENYKSIKCKRSAR